MNYIKLKEVRYFGVSNMTPYQIELIQKYTSHKLIFNQLQFNVVNAGMIDSGINENISNLPSIDYDGGVLDYCRLNEKLETLGKKYGLSKSAMSVAWILRHPAKMQPIAGTTSCEHLIDLCRASDVLMSREDWYDLYLSVDHLLP